MKPLPFKMIVETETEKMRHDTFWSKEPESLAWIESFEGGVFYDIGANVGVYSLYCASLHPDMEIYAFEPVHANFIRLLQNVELNGFENVHCFNVAVGYSISLMEDIYIPNKEIGSSGGQISEPIDECGKEFKPAKKQKAIIISIDDGDIDPDYIKIDVDGHEEDVLAGGEFIVPECKSILIECNKEQIDIKGLIKNMRYHGFTTSNDFNKHPNHSNLRRGGNPENIIFTKEG